MQKLFTPQGVEPYRICQALDASAGSILYTIPLSQTPENLIASLKFLKPETEVVYLPSWDCLPYDRISPSTYNLSQRVQALFKIINLDPKSVVITSAKNIVQLLPDKSTLSQLAISINKNDTISRDLLLSRLQQLGYTRSATANLAGEFAVRGGIVDIITESESKGHRLSFFGDEVDSIKLFDPETQLSLKQENEKIQSLTILPASEVVLNEENITRFISNYRKEFGVLNDNLLEAIKAGKKYPGLEHWLPLFYEKTSTLFDYFQHEVSLLHHASFSEECDSIMADVDDFYNARIKSSQKRDNSYFPLSPQQLYLNQKNLSGIISRYKCSILSPFKDDGTKVDIAIAPSIYLEAQSVNSNPIEFFKSKISELNKQQGINRFLIGCFSRGSLERIRHMLDDHALHTVEIKSWQELNRVKGKSVGICVFPITQGFQIDKTIVFSEQDILGVKLTRSIQKRAKAAKFLEDIGNFYHGEYVVHKEHGIGRFEGIETLDAGGIIHDYLKLIYLGDDKLYVPVENVDVLSKYAGEDASVSLDKLGSSAWQARKAKLKNKLKIAAEVLMETAAKRLVFQSPCFEPIAEIYERFSMSFPYVETEDQLRAITDISSDLAGDKPMDRLVCGDVGFGKTEVAMRATCMVVASPNHAQVLVIVPTTLLARQHYKSFCERFEGLPVKVGQLSRFVSKQEADKVKAGLADGSIDIVIGTHALLSDKIKVKNPGLIIIDEEQHFGVAQKEKIRKLKSNTHILTLSATPIPRTLQMSLTGVKELSLITTPPVDRQPVKTYVMPFDDLIISEAIKREMARGGRVFYVTPRVAYLKEIEEKLKELLPEVRAKHAHGKMSGKELDEIMNQFYDGDFEVLVSTTIIESGLDIPFANTIIIDRADMFGLAQLHQIRGRVGRSNNKAYAYLITSKGYSLNPTAVKRLEAIQSLDNLGAGFSIASHDMDIRGYGNLVGEEQSGHIKEVGIELYQSMLQEAIDNLKHDREETEIPSPTINIGLSVQIPESYIEDPSLRLSMYRKIAQLETKESLESFAAELTDRFGTPPESTEHLFSIIKIKQLAKSAGIIKIDRGEKGILITFHNNKPQNPEKLLLLATSASDRFKIRPDGKFFIQLEPGEKDIVKLIEKVLDKV